MLVNIPYMEHMILVSWYGKLHDQNRVFVEKVVPWVPHIFRYQAGRVSSSRKGEEWQHGTCNILKGFRITLSKNRKNLLHDRRYCISWHKKDIRAGLPSPWNRNSVWFSTLPLSWWFYYMRGRSMDQPQLGISAIRPFALLLNHVRWKLIHPYLVAHPTNRKWGPQPWSFSWDFCGGNVGLVG